MSCEGNKSCGSGECGGCCKSRGESLYEAGFNSIVELEIHYSEAEEIEKAAYTFESLYCLTNTQRKELRSIGLEGNKYDDLDTMRLQLVDCLSGNGDSSYELDRNVDVIYIRDDV